MPVAVIVAALGRDRDAVAISQDLVDDDGFMSTPRCEGTTPNGYLWVA